MCRKISPAPYTVDVSMPRAAANTFPSVRPIGTKPPSRAYTEAVARRIVSRSIGRCRTSRSAPHTGRLPPSGGTFPRTVTSLHGFDTRIIPFFEGCSSRAHPAAVPFFTHWRSALLRIAPPELTLAGLPLFLRFSPRIAPLFEVPSRIAPLLEVFSTDCPPY